MTWFLAAFRAWCQDTAEGMVFFDVYMENLRMYKFDPLQFTRSLAARVCHPSDCTTVLQSRWVDMVGLDQTPSSALRTLMNEVMLRGPLCV